MKWLQEVVYNFEACLSEEVLQTIKELQGTSEELEAIRGYLDSGTEKEAPLGRRYFNVNFFSTSVPKIILFREQPQRNGDRYRTYYSNLFLVWFPNPDISIFLSRILPPMTNSLLLSPFYLAVSFCRLLMFFLLLFFFSLVVLYLSLLRLCSCFFLLPYHSLAFHDILFPLSSLATWLYCTCSFTVFFCFVLHVAFGFISLYGFSIKISRFVLMPFCPVVILCCVIVPVSSHSCCMLSLADLLFGGSFSCNFISLAASFCLPLY